MAKSEKKKRVSIYDLYTREKKVTFTDDNDNSTEILFVKMTQGELSETLDLYNRELQTERKRIREDENNINDLKSMISVLSQEEKYKTIVEIESSYREQVVDIYPIDDEGEKSLAEKKEERKKEHVLWLKTRKEELGKKSDEELLQIILDLRVESISMVKASIDVNNHCISCMARDPETHEKIFPTASDVLKVQHKGLIDKMVAIVQEFRNNMSEVNIREKSQSSDFSPPGQSQSK